MEENQSETVLTKEQIDEILAQAWEAERVNNKLESARLYRTALQQLALFRDRSPKSDFEILNSFLF